MGDEVIQKRHKTNQGSVKKGIEATYAELGLELIILGLQLSGPSTVGRSWCTAGCTFGSCCLVSVSSGLA